jgi:hypothetical protein
MCMDNLYFYVIYVLYIILGIYTESEGVKTNLLKLISANLLHNYFLNMRQDSPQPNHYTRLRAGSAENMGLVLSGAEVFFLSYASRPGLEPIQSPTQTRRIILSPGLKRPKRDADHSSPFSSQSYVSLSRIFMACCLLKHSAKFTFAERI